MLIGGFSIASAQLEQCREIVLPNGTLLTCTVDASGQKVYSDPSGNVYPATTSGAGNFTVVNGTVNPCTAELAVTGISITSNSTVLGTIVSTLDASRPSSLSRIRSNQAATAFPATEDIYFHVRATVSSFPGRTFRSINEVHLFSQNVTTFNPHVNEVFRLVNPVAFEDVKAPGKVVFTLDRADIRLGGRQ